MHDPARSWPASLDQRSLVDWILTLIGQEDDVELRARLERYARSVGDAALKDLGVRLATTGAGWDYDPPDPIGRGLSRIVNGRLIEGSRLEGSEFLVRARERPSIFLANHLAFVDANALDVLISEAGYGDVADRLTTLVGPKVFTRPVRRLASLCFGTVKIPQSQNRASGEAVMPPREAARLATAAIATARDCLARGDHLLIFVEGTRSRNGQMQRALAGVARYLDVADGLLFPVGIVGSERLTPIGDDNLYRAELSARIAEPVDAQQLFERCARKRSLVMDSVGFLIADALPSAYRGVYAGGDPELERAREISHALSA
jgi:1-acyl-sn-glycerol-3-phosphate acyltransferase